MIAKRIIFIFLFLTVLHPASFGQDAAKMQQQMKLLMSREKQMELDKQEEQKALLERQKSLLAEKEKVVLQLQFEQKQQKLQHEKNEALSLIQKNKLKAQVEAALKDKRISAQQKDISLNRRRMLYLVSTSVLVGFIAIIIFLNQRRTKRLNRLVTIQHQELQKVGQVKDRLFSVVGHDLRSPFNILMSLSGLLKEGNISAAKMSSYMSTLETTIAHTSSLMDNILYWAESQLQGYKPRIGTQDIGAIAEKVLIFQKEQAEAKGIILINELEEETYAVCDEDMLHIVLRNLLNNAIKFTPAGGQVRFSAQREQDKLIIQVSDTGLGMSRENMAKFNLPNTDPHESTAGTANEKGTGLGLMLCKTFTHLIGGQIRVEENPSGSGCLFKVYLTSGSYVAV